MNIKKLLAVRRDLFELGFSESIYCTAYFMYKFVMYLLGFIGFAVVSNLILFALFLISFKNRRISFIYKSALIVLSLVILYQDSFLPGLGELSEQLFSGSLSDGLNLLGDLVNVKYLLMFLVVYFICFIATDYIHGYSCIGVFFAVILFNVISPYFVQKTTTTLNIPSRQAGSSDIPKQLGEPTPENIDSYLNLFLEREKNRLITFPDALPDNFEPFDILIVNICSMANDDIIAVKQDKHKVFDEFDVRFEDFNSVSSYSTAATLRLLRANCGQETEDDMYQGPRGECNLLGSLERLGYQRKVFLDHNGVFGDYLKTLGQLAAMPQKIYPFSEADVRYNAFDGAPVYSDESVFRAYLKESSKNQALNLGFMNLISLHDGNRLPGREKSESYGPRLKRMLDDLEFLITNLKESGKRTLLVVIPEHGAAIRGDKMQISRLREIPTSKITTVPLMLKFVNMPEENQLQEQLKVKGQYSFLALSEIIRRAVENNVFSKENASGSIEELCAGLPQQAHIGESMNAFYMTFGDKDYFKLKGDMWAEYKK